MKKYFCFGDVHSFYTELKSSLETAGYDKSNKDHIIVSCGDLLDRGNESIECLNFVNSLPKSRKILIRGNHEDLLEECINRKFNILICRENENEYRDILSNESNNLLLQNNSFEL